MTGRDAMAGPALGTTPPTTGRARNSKVRLEASSAMSKLFGEKEKGTPPVACGGAVHSAREPLTTLRVECSV